MPDMPVPYHLIVAVGGLVAGGILFGFLVLVFRFRRERRAANDAFETQGFWHHG